MSQKHIKEHAARIVELVAELSVEDALKALHEATGQVLSQAGAAPTLAAPAIPFPLHLVASRKGKRLSKIERFPHLKEFIHALRPGLSYQKIADLCREEFGAAIAPSKSSVGRYVSKERVQRHLARKEAK